MEEGATVRENQVLVRLPDQDKMQVKALINEQNITQIQRGMPASIQVDALDGTQLKSRDQSKPVCRIQRLVWLQRAEVCGLYQNLGSAPIAQAWHECLSFDSVAIRKRCASGSSSNGL